MNRITITAILMISICPTAMANNIGTEHICKAAIAQAMGRSPSIMQIDRSEDGILHLSYVRSDGVLWAYRCRIEGNQIIWASDTGRWRTDPADGAITYMVSQDRSSVTVTETYGDGSSNEQTFSIADF